MKTYILQFRRDGVWYNYVDDRDGTTIEFVFLSHAASVTRDLMAVMGNCYPHIEEDWQIKDSTGEVYSVV